MTRRALELWGLSTLLVFLGACSRQNPPTQPITNSSPGPVAFASGSGSGGTFNLRVLKSGTGSGRVTSNPSGIDCGSACSRSFSGGTNVTLTATPAAGSVFAGWSGGGCSGTGPCTTRLDADRTVTANFQVAPDGGGGAGPFTLTVNRVQNGSGSGTVTSSPAGITCGTTCSATFPAGTVITLNAATSSGRFAGWSGGPCAGSSNPGCTFSLNANTTVTATWESQADMVFLESTLPDGNVGADYAVSINTNGGSGGQDEFSLVAGALPDGLRMEKFFGVQSTIITGRPTRQQASTFTVRAQDESSSATRTFTITIGPPVTVTITLPGPTARSGTLGTFYFQNLFASGGATPYTWSITGGQLPPGLRVIRASNGNRIEGTPTARGTFTFTLTVRDQGGQTASQLTSITIQ